MGAIKGHGGRPYYEYTLLAEKWSKCIDYGSPVSSWYTRMFEILRENNGDIVKADSQWRIERSATQ